MIRQPPGFTRTDTLFPYPTLFRARSARRSICRCRTARRSFALAPQAPLIFEPVADVVAAAPEAERIVDRIARRIGAIGGHRPPDQLGARDTLLGGERVEPLDIIVRNVREKAHHVLISYRDITSMLPDRMGKRGSIRITRSPRRWRTSTPIFAPVRSPARSSRFQRPLPTPRRKRRPSPNAHRKPYPRRTFGPVSNQARKNVGKGNR